MINPISGLGLGAVSPATRATPAAGPTASAGVYPTVHESFQSLVVPVFTAASMPSIFSGELAPKIGARAALSDKMLLIW